MSNKSCRLLELPRELRDTIYTYALRKPGKYTVRPQPSHPIVWHLTEPGLLQANKQVRQESLSVFYGLNDWYYQITLRKSETSDLEELGMILGVSGMDKVNAMTKLHLIVFFEGSNRKAGILQWIKWWQRQTVFPEHTAIPFITVPDGLPASQDNMARREALAQALRILADQGRETSQDAGNVGTVSSWVSGGKMLCGSHEGKVLHDFLGGA